MWRAWYYELAFVGELLKNHLDQLKDTVIWNVGEGKRLSGPRIGQVERRRTELYQRMRTFVQRYEFLILSVAQVCRPST